ncbi:GNAT family N-acetyltransferase [Brachybacterium vulturis]|uniref:GNAT family N-acetyltransferase n=1 Tax=Brachybacterium vulturis TaxID=2017484 RepID=UPI003735D699
MNDALVNALEDSQGSPVTVELDESQNAYVLKDGSGEVAGAAYFLPGPAPEEERIFYHTVVHQQFSGRGLSKVLVARALDDARERNLTVVPVCPLFVAKLRKEGEEYRAAGGRFRSATGADRDLLNKALG